MLNIRLPLENNSIIELDNTQYQITKLIGEGGSCLAYSAKRMPSRYEAKIDMPPIPAVIKEFYPEHLASGIKRNKQHILFTRDIASEYIAEKIRFEAGNVNQATFYVSDSSHSFSPAKIIGKNNTIYSVVDAVQGDILENFKGGLNIFEIAQIMRSLCYAVRALHNENKLHLDIKPSNIFLYHSNNNESYRIALFDFDTVIKIEEVETAKLFYTTNWAPYEQVNGLNEMISYATDIYAIGAVLYWLISGEELNDIVLDNIKRKKFSFLDDCTILRNKKSPREDVEFLLSCTLKRNPSERAQKVEEL